MPFMKALKIIPAHHVREATTSPFADRTSSSCWLHHTLNDLLRRTAAGEAQRAIIGHSTTRMSERYSHVAIDERRSARARRESPATSERIRGGAFCVLHVSLGLRS